METTKQGPKLSLIRKLSEVMGAVGHIAKTGRNNFHGYDYATEADIVAAVRKEMAARSLMLIPDVLESKWRDTGAVDKGGKAKQVCSLTVLFRLMDGESGESLEMRIIGEGDGSDDKSTYKAMTGATKYALLKLFLIPTGDDPEHDGAAPSPASGQRSAPRQASAKVAPAQPAKSSPPQATQPKSGEVLAHMERAKRIHSAAIAKGVTDKNHFADWLSRIVGRSAGAADLTPDEMTMLESAIRAESADGIPHS